MPQTSRKKPAESFVAQQWTIVDGKRVDLPAVVFHRRGESKKGAAEKRRKSA
jgi:hypothetical protein